MIKLIRNLFIGLLIAVLSLVLLLMAGAWYFKDKAKSIVVGQINDAVTVPVQIAGDIDFSLLQHFPFASVTFNEVSVPNKLHAGPANLLKVKKFSLLFNMRELLNNKIQISRIHIDNGEFNIYIDGQGNADYEIFKPSTDTSGKSNPTALNLDINKAVVKNLRFTYYSAGKEEDVRLQIEKYTLGGNFRSDRFDLSTDGNMMIDLIHLNGMDYIRKKSFSAEITIDVNQKEDHFKLNKARIEIDKNEFDVEGYFVGNKNQTYVSFSAGSKGRDIARLIALVPMKMKDVLAGAGGSGAYSVSAKITGDIRANINPDILVTAELDKGRINVPGLHEPLEKVKAEVMYHMDSLGMDELDLKHFQTEFEGSPISLKLWLKNLSHPSFKVHTHGIADLHALRTLFADSSIAASGKVAFNHFHLEGSLADIDSGLAENIKASGTFTLKGVDLKYKGISYNGINGTLTYDNQNITIKGFTLNLLGMGVFFDGSISNIISFAISQSQRTNTADLALGFDGKLRIKNLDLSKIIAAYDKRGTQTADTTKTAVDAYDVFNMKGHLNVSIDKFTYDKIVLDNLNADLGISPHRLDINSLSTQAMGGDIADTSYIAFTQDRQMIFTLGLHVSKIDLPLMFRECGNFGQTTLTDKNVKGSFSADVSLRTIWGDYTDLDMDKLEGAVDCSVLHGELNNFSPLQAASKFIKMEELNHIVFSDLNNQLLIKNKVITIPEMEVQSSALNLMMAGTHTFDNKVDYKIKVNLRKLLAAKFGRHEKDEAYIEENPYEGINLYLSVTGDLDNPKIKLDKKAVKQSLKEDLAGQKEELKSIFGKGKHHKKENGAEEAQREEKYYDTRRKPEYIDFQEDTAK